MIRESHYRLYTLHVSKIAELRGLTSEEWLGATYDNAMKVFGLDEDKIRFKKSSL